LVVRKEEGLKRRKTQEKETSGWTRGRRCIFESS